MDSGLRRGVLSGCVAWRGELRGVADGFAAEFSACFGEVFPEAGDEIFVKAVAFEPVGESGEVVFIAQEFREIGHGLGRGGRGLREESESAEVGLEGFACVVKAFLMVVVEAFGAFYDAFFEFSDAACDAFRVSFRRQFEEAGLGGGDAFDAPCDGLWRGGMRG